MNLSEQFALGAVIIALFSLWMAWKSYVVSRKVYMLQKKEHDDKYDEITPYLIEGITWINDKEVFCSFAISYTNKSTSPNSLKLIELEIEYYDQEEIVNRMKILPEIEDNPAGFSGNYKPLAIPLSFKAKETVIGSMTFKLPRTDVKVDAYRVNAFTPSDEKVSVRTHLLMRAINEE